MFYVYTHTRLDTNEVFYVGVGTWTPKWKYKRAYNKASRSDFWKNITAKTEYSISIVQEFNTREEALVLEVELVAKFGRRILGKGSLVNMTDGGDVMSGFKHTEEAKRKISASLVGRTVSQKSRKATAERNRNIVWTAEMRGKLSTSAKSRTGSRNSRAKKVQCTISGRVFDTITEAAKFFGVCCMTICRRIDRGEIVYA